MSAQSPDSPRKSPRCQRAAEPLAGASQAGYTASLAPSDTLRGLGLAVLGAGWHTIGENGMHWGSRVLGCYALHLVVRGTGWFSSGRRPGTQRTSTQRPGTRQRIAAPAAFWLFPGTVHSYRPEPGGWTVSWVLFDGPSAAGYESLGLLRRAAPVVPLADARPVRDLFEELFTILATAGPCFEVAAATQVHRLITTIGGYGQRPDGPAAVQELADHALSPVSLAEHARRLGLTAGQLRQQVRTATGRTPMDYLLSLRLAKAKSLLALTDQPVARIARTVGYEDPAYFTRLFTRRVGQSPTAYRRGRGLSGGAYQAGLTGYRPGPGRPGPGPGAPRPGSAR